MRGRDEIGLTIEDRIGHDGRVAAIEWPDAGQHLVQQHAERPDVAPVIDCTTADVFGAHVSQGAEASRIVNRRQVVYGGNAEIENLHGAVAEQHDVRRLDVAMNDAARVRGARTTRDLHSDRNRVLEWQPPPLQASRDRLAVVERHREEQLPLVCLANLKDRADVWMIERRRRTRFREEALFRRRLFAEVWWQELQRDVASQPRVVRLVDDSHPTRVDKLADQILPDAPPFPSRDLRSGPGRRRRDRGRQSIDLTRTLVRGEQRFDFSLQVRIVAASIAEPSRSIRNVAFDRRREQVLYALPAIGRHRIPMGARIGHRCSSRFNQARAIAHSRLTVAGDTFSASAVSSTLMPP